jgi:hypothetical protein
VASAHQQKNGKGARNACSAERGFHHHGQAILQEESIFTGVTTYYAGIPHKFNKQQRQPEYPTDPAA